MSNIFIPQLWSARLLAHLDKALVFKAFFNNDYEGEISALGDSVKINQFGDITIKDYTGADIDNPEDPTGSQQTLTISIAKYFNFRVKDVLAAQANVVLMDEAMQRAAYALAEAMDRELAAYAVTKAGITLGSAASPLIVTKDNAYDVLVDFSVKFSEKNNTRLNRRIGLPAWFLGMLSKDVRFATATGGSGYSVLENGIVDGGKVASFELRESNNVPVDTVDDSIFIAYAATPAAGTFANQIAKTETYRPEKNFADAVKGLSLYGREILVPDAAGALYIKRGV